MTNFRNLLMSLAFATLVSTSAFAADPVACDMTKVTGLWSYVNTETHVGTFINIPPSGKNIVIQQIPAQKTNVGPIPDYVFCGENGEYRTQLRYPKGYVDRFGNKAQYPLPKDIADRLQGTIHLHDDGTISFNSDMVDEYCVQRTGQPCPGAAFTRIAPSHTN